MIELVAIVAFVAVLISNRSLAERVRKLEASLKSGAPATGPATQPQPMVPQTVMHGGMEEYVSQPQTVSAGIYGNVPVPAGVVLPVAAQPRQPDFTDRFSAWLKEDWLMKLGAFLFIIGLGWFVSYAFANNWIGPVGRISLGIIAGVLVMAFGFWRMMSFPSQGAVFMALGAGMSILSIFAGRAIYQFFTPASAIAFDFIIAAFVSFASYKFNLRTLAFVAQVLAYSSPLLAAGQTNSVFLFSYLLAMTLASLVLSALVGWRDLIVSSLLFVGMYSFPYIVGFGFGGIYRTDAPIILNFAYLFAMVYLLTGMFAVVRRGVENTKTEITLALFNGLFLFLWINSVAALEWKTLIFAAWAIVFAAGSFIAFRASSKLDPFYAYGSVAVAFIAAATASQLHGEALVIAFAIEVLMLIITILTLTKNAKIATTALLLFFAPVILAFPSMTRYLVSQELVTRDLFVLVLLSLCLIFAGRLIGSVEKENKSEDGSRVWISAIIFGTLYIWFTVWCFMHILLPLSPDIATLITLTIYTVAGLWAYFAGLYGNDTARRVYGAALLVFVVARLLLVDVWSMALFGRVITFFAIGTLLMSTAFLTKKKSKSPEQVAVVSNNI